MAIGRRKISNEKKKKEDIEKDLAMERKMAIEDPRDSHWEKQL